MEIKELKCPKCKGEIESLNFSKARNVFGTINLNEKQEAEWIEEFDIDEEQKQYEYRCPECNEILFEDDEEAENFLKGD